MSSEVLSRFAAEAAKLVEPLTRGAGDEEGRRQLLLALGWDLDELTGYPLDSLVAAAAEIAGAAQELGKIAAAPPQDLAGVADEFLQLTALISAIRQLEELATAPSVSLPQAVVAALGDIGEEIVEFLLLEYLSSYRPFLHDLARALTLVDTPEDRGADLTPPLGGMNGQPVYRLPAAPPRFRLDRLGDLLTDPTGTLRGAFLGEPGLTTADGARIAASRIYRRLAPLMVAAGAVVGDGADAPDAGQRDPRRTLLVRFPLSPKDPALSLGALLMLLSDEEGGARIVVKPTGWATQRFESRWWAVEVEVGGQVGEFAIDRSGVTLPAGEGKLTAVVALERFAAPTGRTVLGVPTGTRLELGEVRLRGAVTLSSASWDLDISAAVSSATIILKPAEVGDGFLATVLPKDGIKCDFDLGIGWSKRHGVYLTGAAGLEADFPLHVSLLGVLTVDAVHLGLRADATGLAADVGVTASLKLGPIAASVDRIGLQAKALTGPGGNAGPLQITPAFLPPRGAGLAIDASVVSGGGYILNDYEHGRYAGILQLKIGDVVTVTAIGLIATQMPDGSRGFSLLVILTATFPPIQLGFGFTLSGLGGILGLNRTMNLQALRDGARTGLLDSILFPVDPVPRATKVISDVESVFPVARGRFVIGLQARLGWGTPRLVTVDLGIIIEVPLPLRIALIGKIGIVLPTEKAAVVELHLDVVGTVDTGRGELSIDARLHDSRVAVFTVFGDMAVRVGWGANPTFVVSIGGFNPRFTPPAGFPQLERVTIALATSENPSVRLETYLALTANTIQVGARVFAHAELDAGLLGLFSADAYLGFDALVTLVPFSFIVDLGGGIVIKHNGSPFIGAEVLLTLYGPQPVRAVGYAEVHFLGTHRIPFDITVGPPAPEAVLAAVDPIGALLAALGRVESWSALPPRDEVGLTLRQVAADTLLAHPLGQLAVRERVVPLDVRIERFGGAPIDGGPRSYSLSYRIGADATVPQGTTVRDAWAPGDLFDLQDDEKLSRPSFDQLPSGRTGIAAPKATVGAVRLGAEPGYETRVVDADERLAVPETPYGLPGTVALMLKDLAAGRAAVGYSGPDLAVKVAAPRYRVASTEDLAPVGKTHLSWVEAHAARGNPHTAGPTDGLQVVGAHEVPA